MRIAAIICARNQELDIARSLKCLIEDGIDVILIDNDSTDRTVAIALKYLNHGLLSVESLPWPGYFSLSDLLLKKQQIISSRIDHDWVLNVDADEWLCPPRPGRSLAEAIEKVDSQGFNAINFEEIVFVPWPSEDFTGCDYTRRMTTYYYFAPSPHRLMRAWRRDINASIAETAGHRLVANHLKLYPTSFILRHYIALSHAHAIQKYVSRRYSPVELAAGWHRNRQGIDSKALALRPSRHLRRLERWDSTDFDFSAPTDKHFWEW